MQLALAKGKKNQPVEANLHEREEKERQKTGTGRSVCKGRIVELRVVCILANDYLTNYRLDPQKI